MVIHLQLKSLQRDEELSGNHVLVRSSTKQAAPLGSVKGPARRRLRRSNASGRSSEMRTLLLIILIAFVAAFDALGFAEIVAGVAKTTFFILPTIFAASLVVGLCARRKA